MFLTILLLVVFVSVFASLMTRGLWSNTITLINVLSRHGGHELFRAAGRLL